MDSTDRESQSVVSFPLKLTQQTEDVLNDAVGVATRFSADFIGVEHLFLAILGEGSCVPTQLITVLGLRDRLIDELEALLVSAGYNTSSNAVIKEDGSVLAYLVSDTDGKRRAVDAEGQPLDGGSWTPVPPGYDNDGRPVWASLTIRGRTRSSLHDVPAAPLGEGEDGARL